MVFPLCCALLILSCGPQERYQLRPVGLAGLLEECERAWAQGDREAETLLALGWAYLQKERTREAAQVLAQAVQAVPQDPDAHYYLGAALAREQRKGEAVAAFEMARDLAPGLAEAHWALALLYNERGDGYEAAIEAAQQGLELDKESAYGHFVLGFVLCSRGQNERAAPLLERAIELDPDLAHAHYYLALVHLRRKEDEKAMRAMERTIAADPTYTQAYYSLGTLYARGARLEEGERMIELFQQLSRAEMAEDHYRRLLYRQSAPLSPQKRAASHYNLGLVYLKRGELEEALGHFRAALELDSTYAEASHNAGVVQARQGRHQEARAYFERAVRWKPEYGLAHRNLGHNRLALGEYQGAEAAFRRAVELEGERAETLYGLSAALIQQGRVEEGQVLRRRAQALGVAP